MTTRKVALKKRIYYIEYGRKHLGGTGKRGIDYHKSKKITRNQVNAKLKKLNKRFAYTTLFKFENGKWSVK
jgi:hypothetical protein